MTWQILRNEGEPGKPKTFMLTFVVAIRSQTGQASTSHTAMNWGGIEDYEYVLFEQVKTLTAWNKCVILHYPN